MASQEETAGPIWYNVCAAPARRSERFLAFERALFPRQAHLCPGVFAPASRLPGDCYHHSDYRARAARHSDSPFEFAGIRPCPDPAKNPVYFSSLQRSAKKLASRIGPDCEVVLLGSLASRKYLEILCPIFGNRLIVPAEFIGLGDMSRGGLLLRHVRENLELNYINGTMLTEYKLNRPQIDSQS